MHLNFLSVAVLNSAEAHKQNKLMNHCFFDNTIVSIDNKPCILRTLASVQLVMSDLLLISSDVKMDWDPARPYSTSFFFFFF